MKWVGALVAAGCLTWAGSASANSSFYQTLTGTYSDTTGISAYQLGTEYEAFVTPFETRCTAVGTYDVTVAVTRQAYLGFDYGIGFYNDSFDIDNGVVTYEGGSDVEYPSDANYGPLVLVGPGMYSYSVGAPDPIYYDDYEGDNDYSAYLNVTPDVGVGAEIYGAPGVSGSYRITFHEEGESFPTGVPEPSTWLLMFAGLGGIGLMLRRAKQTVGFRFKDAFSA